MKQITRDLMKKFHLKKLKLDMLGFYFDNPNDLNFHHLIIKRMYCKQLGYGDGYKEWNGSCLITESHSLLHTIENLDEELFFELTSEMIDMKIKGNLDKENLINIHNLLDYFIKEHDRTTSKNGKLLIRTKTLETKEKGLYIVKNM